MAVPVELASEVVASLDEWTQREVRSAIGAAVDLLVDGGLEKWVRPWDLAGLRAAAATLGEVTSAIAVYLDEHVLVAELRPSGARIAQRRIEHGWRLARFVGPEETTLPPETTRRVPLNGSGPDAVLAALGLTPPAGVTARHGSTYLGQGETESVYGYEWTDGNRIVIAEEVEHEIFDGATPRWSYLRGVVVDGEHGVILNGSGEDALLIEG